MAETARPELVDVEAAPLRRARFWQPEFAVDRRPDGVATVHQTAPLGPYPDKLTERLLHFAEVAPDRLFLAERSADGDSWREWTYGATFDAVRRLAAALLAFNLSPERPLVILSGNDSEHALLALAAQHVGIPYAPISPAYSLISTDYGKLRGIIELLTPGLVFVDDGTRFADAIAASVPADVPIIVARDPIADRPGPLFADLAAAAATAAVDDAFARVGPDTIAKFLFTSGSTGSPKGVINTQRMICSNQAMVRDCYAFMQDEPPVVLDWAPWNHTAGGNKVFNMVLFNGGTFYIDDGRPTPDAIRKTVRNLQDVAPTWYFNVPKGYEELVKFLEDDEHLRERFFSRLKLMMYAGAGLAQHTWEALERLAVATTGERILLAAGLGSTETAPFALMCTTEQPVAGNVGVPARGVELKLVPSDDKLEARLKGPNITPGYWRDPDLTAAAFDEEGFYELGDALRFADKDDVSAGFYFDGRIAENFKLRTGTWVSVGALRASFINHFGAVVRDVVLTGLDREYVGALVFPEMAACRDMAAGLPAEADVDTVLASRTVRDTFAALLRSFAEKSTGSSNRVKRLLLIAEPPSIDRGEMTDKGSLNQRAVLRHRDDLVKELYRGSPRVIAATD